MTPAQTSALLALARRPKNGMLISKSATGTHFMHWRPARALVRAGLAEYDLVPDRVMMDRRHGDGDRVRITPEGVAAANRLARLDGDA